VLLVYAVGKDVVAATAGRLESPHSGAILEDGVDVTKL